MKRSLVILISLIALVGLLAACQEEKTTTTDSRIPYSTGPDSPPHIGTPTQPIPKN